MGQPSISISFTELGITALKRSERGIVAMILKGTNTGPFSVTTESDIPLTMSAYNKEQIMLALQGYDNPPSRVIGIVIPATAYTYTTATIVTGDNPTTKGWYVKDGDDYIASTDTIAKSGVTYYEDKYTAVTPEAGDSPVENEWYEKDGDVYTLSEDEEVDGEKTYYSHSYAQPSTVNRASNPASSSWYELVGGEYVASVDTWPADGKVYFSRSSEQSANTDYTAAYDYLSTVKFNYLVVPTVETDGKGASVASFVKTQRANHNLIKAVLPNVAGDNEGIINVATSQWINGDTTYTAEQYCSRIAGIIAGTPLTKSATYAPLFELTDCTRMSRADADAAEEAGKFVALWDGEKVKMGRAVNSLVTTSAGKGRQFQKIKIVDAMDMIASDIRTSCEDNYIGKYANTFKNKCLLLSAINNYFDELMKESVIEGYSLDIDSEANRQYLIGRGIDVTKMTEDEIRRANTGSFVYLVATLSMVDAIEDIVLPITI
jgi:hypothetical protein